MKAISLTIALLIMTVMLFSCNNPDACYKNGPQHRYVPRYDEHPMEGEFEADRIRSTAMLKQIRELTIYRTYVYDICEWCGEKVRRNEKD